MLARESLQIEGNLGETAGTSTRCIIERVDRAPDGYWSATYRVEFTVNLLDGRTLEFASTQRIRGRQNGSKPRRRPVEMIATRKGA